ncbi:MAG: ABC transporter substrate-binding protein [Vicingaceae bacterium]
MRFFHFYFCLAVLFLYACQSTTNKQVERKETSAKLVVKTEHFQLHQELDGYRLKVMTPFVGSEQKETYWLSNTAKVEKSQDATHHVQIPVQKVAINSTTHLGYLAELDRVSTIKGASNLDLAFDQEFQQRVESGEIADLGKQHFDQELLVATNPDVLFAYAIGADDFQRLEDYRRLGQKVVLIAEYMESDPLEKAKWLIALAAFYGKSEVNKALAKYQAIEKRYDSLQQLASKAKKQPTVLLSLPWKGTWYMGGGNSFQARFLADANANYLWKDDSSKASLPLAIETVFERGISADFWLNPSALSSKSRMLETDERFKSFEAFKNDRIFNISKRVNEAGGNDYWESAVVKPDVILADLIQIFHPNLMPQERELYYYKKLDP